MGRHGTAIVVGLRGRSAGFTYDEVTLDEIEAL